MAKNNKQVPSDIAKPGKSAPSATSRPLIVGRGLALKDPMVSPSSEDAAPNDTAQPVQVTVRKVITPPSEKSAKKFETDNVENQSDAPAIEKTDSAPVEQSSKAVVDALANQTAKHHQSQPSEEDIARMAELEKLIEDKKYFVPIGEVTRRRHAQQLLVAIIIFLILFAIGGYLALDANLIETDIILPFDFIGE